MKTLVYLLVGLVLTGPLFAEEQTLLNGEIESGWFGGPVVKFTQINGRYGMLSGGRGGWIINHTFVLGGGGYGLSNHIAADRFSNDPADLQFEYGGGEFEWILRSDHLIHYSLQTLIGGGSLKLENQDPQNSQGDDHLFVVELNANVELNVVAWFRLGAGAGYRFVQGVDIPGLSNADLGGPTGILTFKFGKF